MTKYIAQYRDATKDDDVHDAISAGIISRITMGLALSLLSLFLANFITSAIFQRPESVPLTSVASIAVLSQALLVASQANFTAFERIGLHSLAMVCQSTIMRARSMLKSLRCHKKTILLIAITAAVTVIISSLVLPRLIRIPNFDVPTLGIIRMTGVEGYWDGNLTNRAGTYDWGTVLPGTSANVTIYLRSIGNIETVLNQTSGNWTFWNSRNEIVSGPSNSTSHMCLTWDYDNSSVQPGESIKVTLTLHARLSSDFIKFLIAKDVKAFGFDIHISAHEVP